MYKYTVVSNTWEKQITESLLVPNPRVSACIAFSAPEIFIYGGKSKSGLESDLWLYDTGLQTYTKLS